MFHLISLKWKCFSIWGIKAYPLLLLVRAAMRAIAGMSILHGIEIEHAIDIYLENLPDPRDKDIYFDLFINMMPLMNNFSEEQARLTILTTMLFMTVGVPVTDQSERKVLCEATFFYFNKSKRKYLAMGRKQLKKARRDMQSGNKG